MPQPALSFSLLMSSTVFANPVPVSLLKWLFLSQSMAKKQRAGLARQQVCGVWGGDGVRVAVPGCPSREG